MKRIIFFALMLVPVAAYAAIDTANERRAAAGDYSGVNASGINTAFERASAAGDYLPGVSSSGGTNTTLPVMGA